MSLAAHCGGLLWFAVIACCITSFLYLLTAGCTQLQLDNCVKCVFTVSPYRVAVACLPVSPMTEARAMVEKELGAPIDELFSEFSAKPIAAASLAQVSHHCMSDHCIHCMSHHCMSHHCNSQAPQPTCAAPAYGTAALCMHRDSQLWKGIEGPSVFLSLCFM